MISKMISVAILLRGSCQLYLPCQEFFAIELGGGLRWLVLAAFHPINAVLMF